MRIYAFDPGLATGFAVWGDDYARPYTRTLSTDDVHVEIEAMQKQCDVVVCEDFTITTRTAKLTQQHWSLKLIGALEHWCYIWDVPFVLQMPSDAKATIPNRVLKALDWLTPGMTDHEHDALRHLALYRLNAKVQHEVIVQAMLHQVES